MSTWRTHRRTIPVVLAVILGVHILALIVLRERSLPFSYFIAGVAYLPAILLSLRQARVTSMRIPWLLWTASLTMEMIELLSAFLHRYIWLYLPSLFQVVSFTLCLLVVATPALAHKSRWIRAADIFLAGSVCALCTVAFLLPHDSISDAQWLGFLTSLRLISGVAALFAKCAAATPGEYRLMRFIVIFQSADFFSALILNQVMGTWLHQYKATPLDFLLEVPILLVAFLLTLSPADSFRAPGKSRFVVRSGLPLFFSLTLLPLSLWLLPRNHLAGTLGIAAAILGYAFRSILAQGRTLETEEQLRHSVAHLRKLADHDSLTNAGNRRAFDQILLKQWPHATPESPLALILLDIDFFKQINDSLGHLYGDSCLRALTVVLQDVAKGRDAHVCRFGGDEFAMILPHTPLDQAVLVANRICADTRALALVGYGDSPLTVTLGVAASSPQDGHTIRNLIEESDENLHAAKRAGRNRVQYTPARTPASANQRNPQSQHSSPAR